MNTTLHYYKEQFSSTKGDNLTKIKHILEHHLDQWNLQDEGLVVDLLDAKGLTAEDVLEALQAMLEYEDGHDFKNAVLAMRLSLEKPRKKQAVIDTEAANRQYDNGAVDTESNVIALFVQRMVGDEGGLRMAS